MTNSARVWITAIALLAFVLPVPAAAQQSAAQKPRKPVLKVTVAANSEKGLPVVVSDESAAATEEIPSGKANVRITISEQPGAPGGEPENWLLDGPASRGGEDWLGEPAPAPANTLRSDSGNRSLVGIQDYVEWSQADGAEPQAPAAYSAPDRSAGSRPTSARVPSGPGVGAAYHAGAVRDAYQPRADAADRDAYRLGPGDQLDIHVWRNPELSKVVPVRPDGLISLPLVGEIPASAKTVSQLEAEITAALQDYVQYPTVTVTVTEIRSFVIYVLGQVASPGTLVLDRPINVVQAIAMAGGVLEFASRNDVVVMRTINGQQVRLPFRYGDAVRGKGAVAEIVLKAGDVIYVP